MLSFIKKIKDSRLLTIIDSVNIGDQEKFKKIQQNFPEYDVNFLWLLCYASKEAGIGREYIEEIYKLFHNVLDVNFPKLLASKDNFHSRMWEIILCDVLSVSGKLIPQSKITTKTDFLLEVCNGGLIQIEAVVPNESSDKKLQSIRPDFVQNEFFDLSGNIEDIERPVILRAFDKGFIQKAERKKYDRNRPLIIAINSYKAVGLVSWDEYVLRRFLFGLGFNTVTKDEYGKNVHGLQQNSLLNKPGMKSFEVAVFRDTRYSHVSGVIYTSQNPLGFIPGGHSWYNSGITFVPNPNADHPVEVNFPFF